MQAFIINILFKNVNRIISGLYMVLCEDYLNKLILYIL